MIYRPMYVDKIMAYVDTKMIMEKLQTERNVPAERIISCRFDSMEYEDMTAKQIYAQLKEQLLMFNMAQKVGNIEV